MSHDQEYNAALSFLAIPESALVGDGQDSAIWTVSMPLSAPDGGVSSPIIYSPDQAVVVSDGNGATGIWGDSGFSFVGTPDLSTCYVTIDTPTGDITGYVLLNLVSGSG